MNEIKKILACIRTADKKFNLIQDNDRIALGISGGKDSMVLLYSMYLYSKFNFNNFTIVPIIMDLGFDNFNPQIIIDYCKKLNIDLKIYDAKNVYEILKLNTKDNHHLPCSICSKMKKAIIIKAAKKYKCNKVAFAHHADDAIETLFLNEIKGGKIDTFSPKMFLTKEKITFIRPLILAFEKDIIKTIKENEIPILNSNCPADKHTEREEIKILLNDLYKKYPDAHSNFLTMITNYEHFNLWDKCEYRKIQSTSLTFKLCLNQDDFSKISCKTSIFLQNATYYLIYDNNKIIGYFSYQFIDNKLYLKQLKIEKNYSKTSIFLKIMLEIEVMLFEKYNPTILYTKLRFNYFKNYYKKEGNYYFLPLSGKLNDILNK